MTENSVTVDIDADADGVRTGTQQARDELGRFTKGAEESARGLGFTFNDVFKGEILVDFFKSGLSLAKDFFSTSIEKANEYKAALLGLDSIAVFKGLSPDAARGAVQGLEIVQSGMLSVGDASTALKNLLASGFGLPESIELIKRLGDASAFGRQSALSFGEAVRSATEGIKNGNSNLVDNAGVTKNLSAILKEAGFEMQDLSDKTNGAAARQALFTGLLRETQGQLGDAAKAADTSAGSQSQLSAALDKSSVAFGSLITESGGYRDTLKLITEEVNGLTTTSSGMNETLEGFGIVFKGVAIVAVAAGGTIVTVVKGISAAIQGVIGVAGTAYTYIERFAKEIASGGTIPTADRVANAAAQGFRVEYFKRVNEQFAAAGETFFDTGVLIEKIEAIGTKTAPVAKSLGRRIADDINSGLVEGLGKGFTAADARKFLDDTAGSRAFSGAIRGLGGAFSFLPQNAYETQASDAQRKIDTTVGGLQSKLEATLKDLRDSVKGVAASDARLAQIQNAGPELNPYKLGYGVNRNGVTGTTISIDRELLKARDDFNRTLFAGGKAGEDYAAQLRATGQFSAEEIARRARAFTIGYDIDALKNVDPAKLTQQQRRLLAEVENANRQELIANQAAITENVAAIAEDVAILSGRDVAGAAQRAGAPKPGTAGGTGTIPVVGIHVTAGRGLTTRTSGDGSDNFGGRIRPDAYTASGRWGGDDPELTNL